jgi:CubicO group peptidase (beta-lactamase class C family)
MSFGDALRERICDPLGMKDTACSVAARASAGWRRPAVPTTASGCTRGRRRRFDDERPPDPGAEGGLRVLAGYFDTMGWGFGMSVRTRRTHLGPSVGSYGWPGKYGTAWYNDPAEDMTTIVIMQRAHAGDQRL